mgnify:CR=1 FL=1
MQLNLVGERPGSRMKRWRRKRRRRRRKRRVGVICLPDFIQKDPQLHTLRQNESDLDSVGKRK